MTISVRRATTNDADAIAKIHREAFPRQMHSESWVDATLAAAPRILSYVLTDKAEIAGYAFWAQKAGMRASAVMELEQIAVLSKLRGQGYGEHLIRESLALLGEELRTSGQSLKSVLVSTRDDNRAQHLYRRVLGARVVAKVENLYSSTEVLMLAEVGGA
ncbi:GNAT family N-acetyltransferase [Luteimonas sp. MJ250]|uniref:GNAT family N-acetyltransferase n=1 Tax=Luteimonas sp. MJ250 TaxID=3129236 RepID=UPI0031BB7484